ncbi:E3 ubiquitin-protein ligase RSL1-like [Musa acuminata AAA Group]|uniref:E3 ubiquitin-protein ligase RSL1-like n=1 Tax=Musa acuminata AAA Group TaxID=214697 RepID=UPI0031DFD792
MSEADDLDILVSSQHRKLMAAAAAESDLEFAFRLQMEEAMTASLALHPSHRPSSSRPSSSTAAAATSSSALPPIIAASAGGKVDDDDDNEGLAQVMRLQALELERFHLERKDSDRCQEELRRIADDLRRCAHDERFAREILEMPEDEWEEYGDEFERPIEAARIVDEPTFRLYFKGMASRVLVKDAWVHLAAIGVAVCDHKDNPVLKIQKPVPVSAAGTCREVLEAKALVEGLNAVISLGIKRLRVFCDYRTLYNHVKGIWGIKKIKLANMINQVHILQRKFEKCQIFLLPRCRVRFAFRLARDVLDSQLSKNVDLVGLKALRETCNICLEVNDSSEMFAVDGCLHRFCFSCMKQHVEVKLHHGILPGCPQDGCEVKLDTEGARKFLPPRLLEIMGQRLKEASIPATERVYCPYPRCSALMSRSEAICPQLESSFKKVNVDASGLRKCSKCNGSFCIRCKVPWHERLSCSDFKRLNPHLHPEETKLQSLAKQKLWRQCVKCNHMIELTEGCFHMTCRCGYEFCYTCGAEWKNKTQTCKCPLFEYESDEDSELDDDEDGDEDYEEDEDYDDSDYDDDYYGNYRRLF